MTSQDAIESYNGNIIQHGNYNDRIYLIKLSSETASRCPRNLIDLAKEKGYSKIFAKIPEYYSGTFFSAGFQKEARIPAFYAGRDAAVFMAFYLSDKRAEEFNTDEMKEIFEVALEKPTDKVTCQLNDGFKLRMCNKSDAFAIADIYKTVFPSYPFPIRDPDYILKTMNSHVDYFGIATNCQLVAVSSAEMDKQSSNVEMTDFATLPEWRGNGFAQVLLFCMENKMKNKGIKTAYTIARAMSAGMNITFSKAGYKFGGRLKNNTNISGKIESMNVWYKKLIA